MNWLLLFFLIYLLTGALLIQRTMRGAEIHASFVEWLMLLLFWPFSIKFLIHLALMQSHFEAIEVWANDETKIERD